MAIIPNIRETLVAARWELETCFLIADCIRSGAPVTEADLDRLALALDRMNNVIVILSGDRQVPIREAA